MLVPIAADNQSAILEWVDFSCSTCDETAVGENPELVAQGGTPLGGALRRARAYYAGGTSPLIGDAPGTCRPINVILLTDGEETCEGNAVSAATALRSTTVDGRTYDIRTYVIGFGVSPGNADIEGIATAGGTDAPGTRRGFYATDETSLALAFSQIIESSIRFETCNGSDDDCDTRVDEGFPLYCNRPTQPIANLCVDPGESLCNGVDDNCNGVVDEGRLNACGVCGAVPTEVCNLVDDDCDMVIDEGVCGGCIPSAEICDNVDNDCDTRIDEGISRACGTDVGECTAGTQTCAAGVWGACNDVRGTPETCDNQDDDCNGVIDGISRACGTDVGACQAGTELCTTGTWGSCVGAIGPSLETCNAIDDDCDTRTDEGNPGGGSTCGSSIGECRPGTLGCVGGSLTCTGGVQPGAETCDGQDDDCDGSIDEGVPSMGACGTSTGECDPGVMRCVSGAYACVGAIGSTAEVCNGLDDDCDGSTDESNPGGGASCGSSVGECGPGTLVCTGGALTCSGSTGPTSEICDGEDDDCDGATDEGVPTAGSCGSNVGECGPGVLSCVSGTYSCVGSRGPTSEVCNGRDDDCDSSTDENNPGGGASCGIDTGECSTGTLACTAGVLTCTGNIGPAAETCDGQDDDCDGATDESIPTMGACGESTGECDPGVLACTGGSFQCIGARGATTEVCNALDDDCDGRTDEGNPGGGASCGSTLGECRPGTLTCSAGTLTCTGGVTPMGETCDGEDDDCDGATDESIPSSGSCGSAVGECDTGALQCVGGTFTCVGDRGPADELCNGLDDDCDTRTDEGNPGGGASCGTDVGECTPGTSACVGGVLTCSGGTTGAAETCNTRDDDCDGLVDEGNPGGGARCGASDVGECDFGALACTGGTLVCVGETTGTGEICDGRDNDCDTHVDEDDPEGGAACGVDTGECNPGTTHCVSGALVCDGGRGPTAEVCNGLDDDCDGVEDEGIPVGAPCGSDVGECSPGVNICRDGALQCEGEIGPVAEICNLLDDDCNGSIDEGLGIGPACGTDEGVCMAGRMECVDGEEICVGEMPGSPEVCDCLDNDCNGSTDDPPAGGSLCPAGSTCTDCQCALPCVESEFGFRCPSGRFPQVSGETCFCVAERCNDTTCGAETIRDGAGDVLCAPDDPTVAPCVCRANACTNLCALSSCELPLVCDDRTGTCVEDSCVVLPCDEGEVCDRESDECVPDPCLSAECAADQACRDGTCETSCAHVECDAGDHCVHGACVPDQCEEIECGDEVCDPETGGCVPDACEGVTCRGSDECDPTSGDCVADPCERLHCPDGEICVDGECALEPRPGTDAGVIGPMDGGNGSPDAGDGGSGDGRTRVLAAGGGGCICAVHEQRAPGGLAWSVLAALGIAIVARRRRGAR
ncbi:vWA domain-containing protein [Sandaracinus amylolyticus]|uniref:vWA domain-containing protein n=1 Tax=Sandaracinus amylolyticus TaxID=927083 RepID=UPI001F2843A0|nr:MopE-related protein [Sandaracinus amylolyticus]